MDRQAGIGVVSSTAAVACVVLFLLLAVQLSLHLATASAVTAAGYDSARSVASHAVAHRDPRSLAEAERAAERRFADLVGPLAQRARFEWEVRDQAVHLRVRLAPPRVLPASSEIDRTFVVRIEQVS